MISPRPNNTVMQDARVRPNMRDLKKYFKLLRGMRHIEKYGGQCLLKVVFSLNVLTSVIS